MNLYWYFSGYLREKHRFCGVVVITSALHAEGREFEPRQNLDFHGWSRKRIKPVHESIKIDLTRKFAWLGWWLYKHLNEADEYFAPHPVCCQFGNSSKQCNNISALQAFETLEYQKIYYMIRCTLRYCNNNIKV